MRSVACILLCLGFCLLVTGPAFANHEPTHVAVEVKNCELDPTGTLCGVLSCIPNSPSIDPWDQVDECKEEILP